MTADAGARELLSRLVADPKLKEIERLTLIPPVHLSLALGVWALFLGSSAAYLMGWVPLPVAIVLNAVAVYASFTPLHDATHRAVSSSPFVNDLIGTIAANLLLPFITTDAYRVLHLEHHRWVGDTERDPDTPLVHTRWPWVGFALMSPQLVWAHWWVTKLWPQRTPRERRSFFTSLTLYMAFVAGMLLSPWAVPFLLLYFIPQKLGVFVVAYSFAHIQHPEGVDWKKAPLQATAVITTKPRGLMYWLLLGQNDHHIHHLLPHIPWHRYRHVWDLAEGALHREELAERGFISGFDPQTIAAARVRLDARVRAVREVAQGVVAVSFEPTVGTHFPRFEAGAHVDVHLPSGRVRQYSLCNSPADTDWYEIAVKLDPQGRGGSREVHEVLREGLELTLGTPRNLFRLDPATEDAVLVAGGIGATPLLAMAHELDARGTSFTLRLCARSREQIPFDAELDDLRFGARVERHVDQQGRPGFEAERDLGSYRPGRHLYLCGPAGFMEAVRESAKALGWPESAVHTESFGAAPVDTSENRPFQVELRRSKRSLPIAADSTILDVLRNEGIEVPTACLQGVCGSCKTRVIEGEVEHRDAVLTAEERCEYACLCVSRAKGERLVLDC